MKAETYYIGPRRITSNGRNNVILYLGKDFKHLVGRKVMIVMKVLDEELENKLKT